MCRLFPRRTLRGGALPADGAGLLVDRVEHPAMLGAIVGRVAVAVETGLECRILPAAHRGGDEDHVAPDNRARVGETGQRRAPQHVLAGRRIPGVRQVLLLGNARRVATAERRPMAGSARGAECARGRPRRPDDPPRGHRICRARRQPLAAIENGLPRLAVVLDGGKAHARAVDGEAVARRAQAVLRSGGVAEGHVASACGPVARHRRPALARQREGAGGIKLQREVANHERP